MRYGYSRSEARYPDTANRGIGGPIAKMKAGRPLRLWLVAAMAIAALMVMAFALRLGY
jgi:hypothetical protein